MKHEHFEIDYRLVQLEELSDADRQLVEKAKEATGTSFSPYSHFRVGAALRMENGEVYLGSNQENASFTTGKSGRRRLRSGSNASLSRMSAFVPSRGKVTHPES